MISADLAARAVAHWVGFESACGRESLLSEASLATPVGQVLQAMGARVLPEDLPRQDVRIIPEHPYSTLVGDMDFAVTLVDDPPTLLDAIEMKMVRQSGRNYSQEIFDDLLRLESLPNERYPSKLGRWLLVAGTWDDIQSTVLNAAGNEGNGQKRTKLFRDVLPLVKSPKKPHRVDLDGSKGVVRRYWGMAQARQGLKASPRSFLIDLRGQFPPEPSKGSHYTCMVWRVLQEDTRVEIDLITPEIEERMKKRVLAVQAAR